MPEVAIDNFIYTDRLSSRVIDVKSTRDCNMLFDSHEIETFQNSSDQPLVLQEGSWSYSEQSGFELVSEPDEEEAARLKLLREKIKVLHLVKLNTFLYDRLLDQQINDEAFAAMTVRQENYNLIQSFCENEKQILRAKAKGFFEEFKQSVDAAKNLTSIGKAFADVRGNVATGGFAISNRINDETAGDPV